MPLTKSASKQALRHNIAEMVLAGHPQKQAVAAAFRNQRSVAAKASHKSTGGPVVGLIRSSVPGRTDRHPINVWRDSYVIPADVVSGWGQGNTEAGSAILDQMFTPHLDHARQRASGGRVSALEPIPIIAAGGEYVVHPHAVWSMGGGNMSKGHRKLDQMVKSKRLATAKQMQRLPGPRKD